MGNSLRRMCGWQPQMACGRTIQSYGILKSVLSFREAVVSKDAATNRIGGFLLVAFLSLWTFGFFGRGTPVLQFTSLLEIVVRLWRSKKRLWPTERSGAAPKQESLRDVNFQLDTRTANGIRNSTVFGAVLSAGLLLFRVPVMAVTSDNFAAADLLSGTNFTYTSTLAGATLEAGEPVTAGTNTVWMTWTAPDSGYLGVQMAGFWPTTSYAVYTGPSVDQLQPVSLSYLNANATWRFVTTKGTAYHFQFSGAGDTFTFSGTFHLFGKCVNDNFADAPLVNGGGAFGPDSVMGATMELGEPAQMGDVPQKSLWWRIQSPVSTTGYIDAHSSLVTNLMLALYTGDSVDTLHRIGQSSNK